MTQRVTPTDAAVNEPVTLINAFTVPLEESERFVERWKDNMRAVAGEPGLIRARLFRSLINDAELRFVNVAEWDSGKALAHAHANPEWQATVQRLLTDPNLHVIPRPSVYQAVVDFHPGDTL